MLQLEKTFLWPFQDMDSALHFLKNKNHVKPKEKNHNKLIVEYAAIAVQLNAAQ